MRVKRGPRGGHSGGRGVSFFFLAAFNT
jgi:hypothetical protein